MSDRYCTFDTHIAILYEILCHMAFAIKCHKMAFYGILWQMPYDIKCYKVWQYGYQKNRIDQTNWLQKGKSFHRNKIKQKMEKTKFEIFPLYFLSNAFVKKNWKFTVEGLHQFRNQSYQCIQYIKYLHFFTTHFKKSDLWKNWHTLLLMLLVFSLY